MFKMLEKRFANGRGSVVGLVLVLLLQRRVSAATALVLLLAAIHYLTVVTGSRA